MMNSRDVETCLHRIIATSREFIFMYMTNLETTASITHIRLSEKRLSIPSASVRDVFGERAEDVTNITDRIDEIDPGAADFLLKRACEESCSGQVVVDDVIIMLQDSLYQLEELSRQGLLYVSAA